jgi:hypothetical protein
MSTAGNVFSRAVGNQSNFTTGNKGAIMKESSGDLRLDAFVNLNKESSLEKVVETVRDLVSQIEYLGSDEAKGEWVADIWRLWVHKRHPRVGEKEKLLGRRLFLELYNYYPETCISLVKARIFGDIAYWKEVMLIWGMIMDMTISDSAKFAKYNRLVEAFRISFMDQRNDDLKTLDTYLAPKKIRNISKVDLVSILRANKSGKPTISMIGKYCVREKSPENKQLSIIILNPPRKMLVLWRLFPYTILTNHRNGWLTTLISS